MSIIEACQAALEAPPVRNWQETLAALGQCRNQRQSCVLPLSHTTRLLLI